MRISVLDINVGEKDYNWFVMLGIYIGKFNGSLFSITWGKAFNIYPIIDILYCNQLYYKIKSKILEFFNLD